MPLEQIDLRNPIPGTSVHHRADGRLGDSISHGETFLRNAVLYPKSPDGFHVFLGQFSHAVSFSKRAHSSISALSVAHVVGRSADVEMRRTQAGRIVAMMENEFAISEPPAKSDPQKAGGEPTAALIPESSVAAAVAVTRPLPTSFIVNIDFGPEASEGTSAQIIDCQHAPSILDKAGK